MSERAQQDLAADELQNELRDLSALAVFGDHVRWVLIGDDIAALADWLADATVQWRGWADQVAKHLVMLGVAPDGRIRSLTQDIPLNWVPAGWLRADEAQRLVASRLSTVAGWGGYRRSHVSDSGAIELLDAVCSGLKAQAHSWAIIHPVPAHATSACSTRTGATAAPNARSAEG